jgi:hypothetical protein
VRSRYTPDQRRKLVAFPDVPKRKAPAALVDRGFRRCNGKARGRTIPNRYQPIRTNEEASARRCGANRGFRAIPRLFTNTGVANLANPTLIVVVPKNKKPQSGLCEADRGFRGPAFSSAKGEAVINLRPNCWIIRTSCPCRCRCQRQRSMRWSLLGV